MPVLEGLGERFCWSNGQRPTQVPMSGDMARVVQDADFECFIIFMI